MSNADFLPGWIVESVDLTNKGRATVHATPAAEPDHCPHCGVIGKPLGHGPLYVTYTEAPLFGRRCEIRAKIKRYRCRECGKTSRQPNPAVVEKHRMTCQCYDHIAEQALQRPYAQVAREVGIDEKVVRQIVKVEQAKRLAENPLTAPAILGIDELTLLDRRRSIFTDVGERRVLDLVEDMSKETVQAWLYDLPDKERVRIVTIDMWAAYRTAAYLMLPNARVVVDKWHIQKKAMEVLDEIRVKLASKARSKKERQRALRGRRLLMMRRFKLGPRATLLLDGWLSNNPVLKAAWIAKEGFYDIWDATSVADAEARFLAWRGTIDHSVMLEFSRVARTVQEWRKEIFAYFDAPFTNAYTEAENGLIKMANRLGRGYSFKNIRAKALLRERVGMERYWVCDSCLGQFSYDVRSMVDASHIQPLGPPATPVPGRVWCERCHDRIHSLDEVSHSPPPTG
jgi:transposase